LMGVEGADGVEGVVGVEGALYVSGAEKKAGVTAGLGTREEVGRGMWAWKGRGWESTSSM
jgi:hypothetical protein